ncbi:MAG: methyl-accepting chemotaxis protein [Gomphosphaeria aponina SAG 52.96 = DSM 107014]|uniref:Methyl-accepting chemotaxis protein n=1 Tax=Gomphosphaeria aponina SAG 52.96 = DSM 107014 TaxID=1521640 RepID=A0A941GPT7_9CHRO|nr:methyl-accepting chemotaxis protein [Gomphosphaeria aponina SAG 52.96 = DSM 107014]
MFNLLQLFPPYLIILTIVLVFIPTIAAFLVRIALYKYLVDSVNKVNRLLTGKSREKQPKIIDTLETRFKTASSQLEQVNTPALIDGIYSQERFKFLGFSLRCEEWNYFSEVLPNLLLAFGLLGTFLGITLNLYNLSQTINLGGGDISSLPQKLQTPLQSMGIAFITSLIALVCSSFLLVTNLRCNTNLAKNFLISSLEDYLDNVLKPTIQGDTRLDKAVNKMVEQQNEFLTRFHEKVGQVLEITLGRVTEKMIEENKIANSLAREVYERFMESSGTMVSGANTFKEVTEIFSSQVKIITEIVPQLQEYSQKLENGAISFQTAAQKIEQSKFSENLENITADLAQTQKSFSQSTAFLGEQVGEIVTSNKRATELTEQLNTQLQESAVKLQDSALGFMQAAEIIQQSEFPLKLQAATDDLATTQKDFAASASILNQSTESIESAITNLQDSVKYLWEMGKDITQLNQKSGEVINLTQERLMQEEGGLSDIQSEMGKLVTSFKNHEENLNQQLRDLISILGENLGKTTQNLQGLTTSLNETQSQQAKLVNNLNSNFQYLGDNITKVIVQESKSNKSQIQQSIGDLQEIKNNLSKLVSLIEQNVKGGK